jgi:hypothetical protein
LPAIAALVVLAVVVSVVWLTALNTTSQQADKTKCDLPANSKWQALAESGLNTVVPVSPASGQVTVFNATTKRGTASLVSALLKSIGFTNMADPTGDPSYPKQDMSCYGQIRFGANGKALARTLSLTMPCAQLVNDDRKDNSVSLSIGLKYSQLNASAAVQSILTKLSGSASDSASVTAAAFTAARNAAC